MRAPSDKDWMRKALRLARRAWGQTTPNPMVGAVLVRHGREVGAGYHHRAGLPHAEVEALHVAAGARARGATLYVTLEPCCTHGRTPPCTDAILAAGVARVVVGCLDPNPRHAGRGVAALRDKGIEVEVGVLEAECRELNEAFFCWIQHRRPFVLLKMAMTLDGRIATASGESQWITGEKARAQVQKLRQWAGAILVGGETVRRDNPNLTVRSPQNWWRQPLKLVWSRQRAVPKNLNIWKDPTNPPRNVSPATPAQWRRLLAELGAQEVTALLIEGGGELAAACLRAGIVDKVQFYVAPKILGGRGSRPVVGGPDPIALADALALCDVRIQRVGADFVVTGRVGSRSAEALPARPRRGNASPRAPR
ncbi:MAG: riboflavin biosynthesis protein RibD [Lentisphaerae bacterium RIFOXYA12_64_32]|nr:MAG: riboflavin biosynthesis protein RibD [Lentisphaerae bacterium RIFOXYA12_64_32]